MDHVGSLGSNNVKAVGNTVTLTTTDDVLEGEAALVWVAWDSRAATETGTDALPDWRLECTDEEGNVWVTAFAGEHGVGAGASVHVALFFTVARHEMPAGTDITVTDLRAAGSTSKAISAERFDGLTKRNLCVAVNGRVMPTGQAASADPSALTLASMQSREYILAHAVGMETGVDVASYTQDSDYTSITFAGPTGGTDHQNVCVKGGWRIATLTGDTVDVAIGAATDLKQGLVALYETDAPGIRWARSVTDADAITQALRGTTGNPWTQRGDVVLAFFTHGTAINRESGSGALSHVHHDALLLTDVFTEVLWMRSDGTETAVSLTDLGNNVATVVALYGCAEEGLPWYALTSATAAADTAVTVAGGTTEDDETLVLALVNHGIDADGAQVSGWTNANLVQQQELADQGSLLGNGLGHAILSGILPAAGATGDVTATLASSDEHGKFLLALRPADAPAPDAPWIEHLNAASGTGAVAVSWNADRVDAGDILLVAVSLEGPANLGITVPAPTDYAELASSPQTIGDATTTDHQVQAFWKVADGTETSVSVDDGGDHTDVAAMVIKNVGDSPDATNGGATTTSSGSVTMPGVTTTVADALVIALLAQNRDSGSRNVHTGDCAGLVGPHRHDASRLQMAGGVHSSQGRGGGVYAFAGVKEAAGATGDITAELQVNSKKCWLVVAFGPPGGEEPPAAFVPRLMAMFQ